MAIWWTLIILQLQFSKSIKKLPNTLSKSLLYFQVMKANSALFGAIEVLDHSFQLKIMLSTTAALFMKKIVRIVRTMSVNP